MTKRKEKRSSTRYVGYHKTDEIECQIRYKYEGDKRSQIDTVFGRAVDPLSKSPIGNGSYHQRKVSNGDVDSAEAYVLNAVLKEWIKKNKPKRPVNSTPASEEKYTERLNKITINDAINLIQKQRHWATLTVRQALTYLRGRVAKLLNIYAENPLEVDWGAIEKGLKSKANGSTHVKKSLDHSIGNQFHYAAECYEILRQNCPELNLPYLDFPDLRTTKAASPEKRKWLPMKVRIMFVRALWELANNQVPLAFAAALMYYCGLRPAEAMAPCMGDFHISADGSFGTYRVSSQIQEKNKFTRLKPQIHIVLLFSRRRPCTLLNCVSSKSAPLASAKRKLPPSRSPATPTPYTTL